PAAMVSFMGDSESPIVVAAGFSLCPRWTRAKARGYRWMFALRVPAARRAADAAARAADATTAEARTRAEQGFAEARVRFAGHVLPCRSLLVCQHGEQVVVAALTNLGGKFTL